MSEVTPSQPVISDAALAEIASFDDALALAKATFGDDVVSASGVLGTGFGIADEKAAYIKVPFVVLKASRNLGDQGRFWSLMVVTKDGRKVILNDGGTGIADQMDELSIRHPEILTTTEVSDGNGGTKIVATLLKPMMVEKGLRVSHYVHPEFGPAATYYLDTSALA
jgi:hypothetical protein